MAAPKTLFASPKPGGTLVIGSTQVPRHFNGAVQSGIATAMPSTQIFASPLRYDDKWNPQPYLAESWEMAADGKSITLKLVKTAVFHDGAPLTSEDVAFSIMTRSEEHTSELQSLMRISYAVFCLTKKNKDKTTNT